MHRLVGLRPEDVAALYNVRGVSTGMPEPEWLRRQAEYARELPLLLQERRVAERDSDERKGIVARLRLVLSRA